MSESVRLWLLLANLGLEEICAAWVTFRLAVPGSVGWIVPLHHELQLRCLTIRPCIVEIGIRSLLLTQIDAQFLIAGLDAILIFVFWFDLGGLLS